MGSENNENKFDFISVGAGQAGNTAAYVLAKAGATALFRGDRPERGTRRTTCGRGYLKEEYPRGGCGIVYRAI